MRVVSPASEAVPVVQEMLRVEKSDQALLRRRRNRTAPPIATSSAAIPPKIRPLAPVCARDLPLLVFVSPAALVSEEDSFVPELTLLLRLVWLLTC